MELETRDPDQDQHIYTCTLSVQVALRDESMASRAGTSICSRSLGVLGLLLSRERMEDLCAMANGELRSRAMSSPTVRYRKSGQDFLYYCREHHRQAERDGQTVLGDGGKGQHLASSLAPGPFHTQPVPELDWSYVRQKIIEIGLPTRVIILSLFKSCELLQTPNFGIIVVISSIRDMRCEIIRLNHRV